MLTNTNQPFRKKRNIELNIEELLQQNIKHLLLQFNGVNDSIKSLKKKDTTSLSALDLRHYNKELDMLIKKKDVLSKNLSSFGYYTERRGRPKKDESEKYKSTHIRMSCYFTETNTAKLRLLKEEGSIENISSFLNELLEAYFTIGKAGVNDEK